MDIQFKPIERDDIPEIIEIYDYYVKNSTATFHICTPGATFFSKYLFIDDPVHGTFRMVMDGVTMGYCILGEYSPREAYAQCGEVTLYIKKEYTGKGYGSKALQFLEHFARKNGYHTLLARVSGENIASIKLFEKHGYRICGRIKEAGKKFGRYLDVIYYQKMLNE